MSHPVQLQVTGLGSFHDQVVFARLEEGEALNNLVHISGKSVIDFPCYTEQVSLYELSTASFTSSVNAISVSFRSSPGVFC